MLKVGRNDPCPCGSGKKFKRCCSERVQEQERLRLEDERERVAAELAALEAEVAEDDEYERLSEHVLALIEAQQLDDAEAAARQLEARFPEDTMGTESLARVYEARGAGDVAAEHYRRAVARMDELGDGKFCDCCRARMVKAIRRLDPGRPAPALGRDPQ